MLGARTGAEGRARVAEGNCDTCRTSANPPRGSGAAIELELVARDRAGEALSDTLGDGLNDGVGLSRSPALMYEYECEL